MAEEQKKLYPDCWKRKRSLASVHNTTGQTGQSPIHSFPPGKSPGGKIPQNVPPGWDKLVGGSSKPVLYKVESPAGLSPIHSFPSSVHSFPSVSSV